ncbi:hypothetical protein C5167_000235 [Papaver somniferum]|uniref:Uncharacterized protein n=1 Tax=Papaver somniferum TaxID=3469 RepID=A0A4Y7KS13_PAPSO|nr:hypothetical protein C5167_000235 [Papaver somniferum]
MVLKEVESGGRKIVAVVVIGVLCSMTINWRSYWMGSFCFKYIVLVHYRDVNQVPFQVPFPES